MPGFKWHHLTEKFAYDQKMREVRLKEDMSRANKELEFYQDKKELSKKIDKMENRRMKKLQKMEQDSEDEASAAVDNVSGEDKKRLKQVKK